MVDIGGGSTEFIIGLGFEPLETESLQIGCIATTRRFFDDGKLTRKRWQKAQTEIEVELQQFAAGYRARGWSDTIGSSGTVRALGAICAALRPADNGITLEGLEEVRERLLEAGEIGRIRLPALSEDRKAVIAGGALILETVFRALAIERMRACDTAMREGLLYDLVGRAGQSDPREASVLALARRYGVDAAHAARVETTALALFEQVQDAWEFNETQRDWLAWACRVHEIGLAIAHSQHQVHGAYLVANSDLFGFTRQEQQALAFVVRAQRRAIPVDEVNALPERLAVPAARLAVLLRLSALLHRGRTGEVLPRLALKVGDRVIRLALPRDWLDTHPLTRVDLDTERKHLAELNLKLQIIAT